MNQDSVEDILQGDKCKITILGLQNSGKTSLVNRLVNFPLYKTSLVDSTPCCTRTHLANKYGIQIDESTTIKHFESKEELQAFIKGKETDLKPTSSIDVYVKFDGSLNGSVITEFPGQAIPKDGSITDILVLVVGISDVQWVKHPEEIKCMLKEAYEMFDEKELDPSKLFLVTNKWDTILDENEVLQEDDKIWLRFKSLVKECLPNAMDKQMYRISLRQMDRFEDLKTLVRDIEKSTKKYLNFTIDDAKGEIISINQTLTHHLCMEEFKGHLQEELLKASPKLLQKLSKEKQDLEEMEWKIVVAGDTSAGKTTFINRIAECQIFVPRTLASTGNVCRIRSSERFQVKLYTKELELLEAKETENASTLREILRNYTELGKIQPINGKDIHFVDIYLPSPMLQKNTVLVDTPGIGFSESLDKVLFDFLPNASSFIFIVDAANAGGIQEDRLMKILQVVVQKQKEMPYFELCDVMFLTNKWDNVELDDSSSDSDSSSSSSDLEDNSKMMEKEDAREKTYRLILETLSREWPAISKENVFQVCLKNVEDKDSRYAKEYDRFQHKLHEVLEKNKFRAIFAYFKSINDDFENIERVVCSRVAMCDRDDGEHSKFISEMTESLADLQSGCIKEKEVIEKDIWRNLIIFGRQFHSFLHSEEGKTGILQNLQTSKVTSIMVLKTRIASLLMHAIETWIMGEEVSSLIRNLDARIRKYAQEAEDKVRKIENEIQSVNTALYTGLNEYEADLSSIYISLLPSVLSFSFVETLPLRSYSETGEILKEKVYNLLISNITEDTITICLGMSIADNHLKSVRRIHDVCMKKEESMRKTIENLKAERATIQDNKHLFSKLKSKNDVVRRKLSNLARNLKELDRWSPYNIA